MSDYDFVTSFVIHVIMTKLNNAKLRIFLVFILTQKDLSGIWHILVMVSHRTSIFECIITTSRRFFVIFSDQNAFFSLIKTLLGNGERHCSLLPKFPHTFP